MKPVGSRKDHILIVRFSARGDVVMSIHAVLLRDFHNRAAADDQIDAFCFQSFDNIGSVLGIVFKAAVFQIKILDIYFRLL